jgi:hypothetical protein
MIGIPLNQRSRLKGASPKGRRVDYKVTSCGREVGWSLCANKHRCDAQPSFFGNIGGKLVFFCDECAVHAMKHGVRLHRIV